MADEEIVSQVERRRKWTLEEKAALMAEVEAEGGKVKPVARRHRVSESLLYNWRSAWKSAASAVAAPGALAFVPLGVIGDTPGEAPARLPPPPDLARSSRPGASRGKSGAIEIALPNGACVSVDALVNEKALSRVLRAMKGVT